MARLIRSHHFLRLPKTDNKLMPLQRGANGPKQRLWFAKVCESWYEYSASVDLGERAKTVSLCSALLGPSRTETSGHFQAQ
jgi:hypothetical protein